MTQQNIEQFLMAFPVFLFSICCHEFAHAWVADRMGDPTPRSQGRLTLNPIPHSDLFWTILLPAIGILMNAPIFGAAKPVVFDPRRFKSYRKGLFLVASAGPIMNILLCFVSAGIITWLSTQGTEFYFREPLEKMMIASVLINAFLAVFNLIPMIPFDGGVILESVLSYEGTQRLRQVSQYGFWILIALIFTGAIKVIAIPAQLMAGGFLWFFGQIFA